ncbi:MAG TPA: tyrosine-type recombinase/integrase [Ktedonobacterales bacterium]|nr:tyrosine-type recombinase/integrase [Ktedonobacterales bacterium]
MASRTPDSPLGTNKRRGSPSQAFPRRAGKTLRAAIDEFLLDRQSQKYSPKTLKWHTQALAHLADFLEQQHGVTHLWMIESVHLRAWMVFLEKQPSAKGKPRAVRTLRWYAQSMHAFCHWLASERYVEENPAERVKLPKLEKPLIRIIEFEEFEALLKACAPPQETGDIADRNTARNRAILWLLWDTGIRLSELCDLRLSNLDRRQGTIIVFGKGRKERRIALGRNALRALLYYLDRWRQGSEEADHIEAADDSHVFLAETGQALTLHGIEMLFKRLRLRAGLTDRRISPHIFRHTFAVRYLMLGGDVFSLQEILGHEDMSTVKFYMHLNDANIQAQKRKFSPGDNVPFALQTQARKQRTDFRKPAR